VIGLNSGCVDLWNKFIAMIRTVQFSIAIFNRDSLHAATYYMPLMCIKSINFKHSDAIISSYLVVFELPFKDVLTADYLF
jgi:hypothetical protein